MESFMPRTVNLKNALKSISIDKIHPYDKNSRVHSDEQIRQLAEFIKSIDYYIDPIVIDENKMILAGHGRVMAAKQLGMNDIPCIIAEGLTEAQKKAYIIADNKIAENAAWDTEILKVEIESLKNLDFDVQLIGFSVDNISCLENDIEFNPDLPDENEIKSSEKNLLITVQFDNEEEHESLYIELRDRGYKVKV